MTQLAVACVALLVAAPTALAATGDPKQRPPEGLWEAFPVNPTGERLDSGQQSRGPRASGVTPERLQTARTTPDASRTNVVLLALVGGAGVFLLSQVSLSVVRRRDVSNDRPRSAPLWQGREGFDAVHVAGAQHLPDIDASPKENSHPAVG